MTDPAYLPWGLTFQPDGVDAALTASMEFDAGKQAAIVRVSNGGSEAVAPGRFTLRANMDDVVAGGWVHLQGRSMGEDALTVRFGEEEPEGYSDHFRGENGYVSRELVALQVPSRATPALLIGSLRGDRYFTDIGIEVGGEDEDEMGAITVTWQLDATSIGPGETLELPPLYLAEGHDAYQLLGSYADAVAVEMAARVPEEVPAGWCSWYFYYNRVSEADVVANLEAMAAQGHPADYVQVDDGHQSATGDWLTPNEKFPSGMQALAERIADAGYRPGLWLAPFVMHRDSAVLREHPEFALRRRDGSLLEVETWLGPVAVMDCTHQGAEAWLREVIRTVVRGWGYTFLKLDALVYAAQPGGEVAYHDQGMTGAGNLRRGLEIIRDEAGGRTFLLGCTCPFMPAIGLVDAMRVGPDVKATWVDGVRPSVKHAMRMTLQRNWMHRRWWLNDPDCLVLRANDTELSEAEVRFLASAVAFSGGLVVSSDDLSQLDEERATLTRSLIPAPGIAATPIDGGEAPVPSEWRARLDETRSLVGVLNWGEESRWVSVNEYLYPGEVAFNPWTGQILGKGDLLLRPHEGSLWQVTARSPAPRVVGDTGHVNYEGLFVRQVSGRLQLRNDLSRARTVAVEARGQVRTWVLEAGEMRWFD